MILGFLMVAAADPFSSLTGISKSIFVYSSFLIILCALLYGYFVKKNNPGSWGAMQYPQLVLGMLAIFMYVGTEVTIQSNLGALLQLKEFGGLSDADIKPYISLYWGSMMIGRCAGAVSAFNLSKMTKNVLNQPNGPIAVDRHSRLSGILEIRCLRAPGYSGPCGADQRYRVETGSVGRFFCGSGPI